VEAAPISVFRRADSQREQAVSHFFDACRDEVQKFKLAASSSSKAKMN